MRLRFALFPRAAVICRLLLPVITLLALSVLAAHAEQIAAGTPIRHSVAANPTQSVGGQGQFTVPSWAVVGPLLVALTAGAYATVMIFAVIFRRELRVSTFVSAGAARIENGFWTLTLWGLAELVLVPVVGIALLRHPPLVILGLIVLLIGSIAAGFALAAAASWIGRRLTSPDIATDNAQQIVRGMLLILVAAVLPVIGWIAAGLAVLAGLGAVSEQAVIGLQGSGK